MQHRLAERYVVCVNDVKECAYKKCLINSFNAHDFDDEETAK